MNADRFDATTKIVIAGASRRRALGSLLGGALGLRGLAAPETRAARSGTCKPACGECALCKKGKCDRKKGKKRCKKGKCLPKSDGERCTAFAAGVCRNGACVDLQSDEANCGAIGNQCGPSQVCQEGFCFSSGTCPASTTAFTFCVPGGATCGSGCSCGRTTEGNVLCLNDDLGFCGPDPELRCTTSADCPGDRICVDVSGCCPDPGVTKGCLLPCFP